MTRVSLAALLGFLVLCGALGSNPALPAAENEPLRVIAFGAHPDDCELKAGGTGALWARAGHKVLLVSMTNGDIGHWRDAGGPLANRRREEARRADAVLGVESKVLDNHDGELMAALENRRAVVRLIREWQADIVLAPRACDYHPDHRYAGILVQDAGYMVTVPFFCPDTPHLACNPVFLYFEDGFQRPYPFNADVVVAIDAVIEKKLDALALMESQFLEGGCNGGEAAMPKDAAAREARQAQIRDNFRRRFAAVADRFRDKLIQLYGPEKGARVKYAEAFEICEYGRRPTPEELRRLFPMDEGAKAQ